eukprot:2703723-Lingulodinium_polyedra.AAC.1
MNALDQLERQAETIGRRAVAIDGLPGGGERPSVVAAILNAIGARDEGPGEPKRWVNASSLQQHDADDVRCHLVYEMRD